MKQLQKNDLKEGEIYKQLEFDYIFLYNKNETSNSFNDGTAISIYGPRYYKRWSGNDFEKPMVEATPEEKHWLKECIKADNFVSYEDAMKTFIPEYVECVARWNDFTIGKIYTFPRPIDDKNNIRPAIITWEDWKNIFKPSTKKAYDAQFKEPEFVLPEKWCIKVTNENRSELKNKLPKIGAGFLIGQYIYYFNYNKNNFNDYKNWSWNLNETRQLSFESHNITKNFVFPEITFNQFKQYVLKENTTVTEKPKVIFEEPKDKVLKYNQISGKGTTIVQVECSEGGVYKIGDKITVFDKISPNKGKPFTIKSFRWTNDKSKICAVTELHTPNGIGLDKIELYIEPKVKIVEDFVLPEKWCVRFNKKPKFIEWCNENTKTPFKKFECLSVTNSNYFHYPLNTIQVTSKDPNYTEITFEQFKKHVLKNE